MADELSWSIDVAVEAQECLPIGVTAISGLGALYGGWLHLYGNSWVLGLSIVTPSDEALCGNVCPVRALINSRCLQGSFEARGSPRTPSHCEPASEILVDVPPGQVQTDNNHLPLPSALLHIPRFRPLSIRCDCD